MIEHLIIDALTGLCIFLVIAASCWHEYELKKEFEKERKKK